MSNNVNDTMKMINTINLIKKGAKSASIQVNCTHVNSLKKKTVKRELYTGISL